MAEKHLVGNIYVNDDDIIGRSTQYGVSVLVRNRGGQGMTLPLNYITPNDLRVLADFLEKEEAKTAQDAS